MFDVWTRIQDRKYSFFPLIHFFFLILNPLTDVLTNLKPDEQKEPDMCVMDPNSSFKPTKLRCRTVGADIVFQSDLKFYFDKKR